MKKRDLIRKINSEAKRQGLPSAHLETDGKHDKLVLRSVRTPIGRHKEIPAGTAENIMKEYEQLFGEDWWRNGKK